MKIFKVVFLVSVLAFVGCSRNKKKSNTTVADSESIQEDADFVVDADDEELIADDSSEDEEIVADSDEGSSEELVASSEDVEGSGDIGQYTVKKNETLMIIAFNIYGDYRKWKDLSELNSVRSSALSEGMTLSYKKPSTEFSWNPEGLPYLIKNGDSLVSISDDKYGTPNKWRSIYNNNKPLIRDPNLIFAGFTIYYVPSRDIASQK